MRPHIELLENRTLFSALAPASLVGRRVDLEMIGDRMDLQARGRYVLHAPSGDEPGTYSYIKTGPAAGVLRFSVPADVASNVGLGPEVADTLNFTTRNTGAVSGDGWGVFILQDRAAALAPSTIAGLKFICTDDEGQGTFELRPSKTSYIMHVLSGGYLSDSQGSYTYTPTDAGDGSLSLNNLGQTQWSGSFQMVTKTTGWYWISNDESDFSITNGAFSIQGTPKTSRALLKPIQPAKIQGTLVGHAPAAAAAGGTDSVTVQLRNPGKAAISGPYIVAVSVAAVTADGQLGLQTPLAHIVLDGPIQPGTEDVALSFTYGVPAGDYKLTIAGGAVSNQWDWIVVSPIVTKLE